MTSPAKITLASLATAALLLPLTAMSAPYNNDGYLTDMNHEIVTSATTGLCYRTSEWSPAKAAEECDPEYFKKAAAVPAPAPAPEKMAPQKINFSADALFDFDKSVLKPQGKAMLDDLARTLNGVNYDVVMATGYTDRIGTNAYNNKLSQRRANAVKQYLTSKGIPPNKVYAEGKGESNPVTKPGECKKGMGWKSLVKCLAPDRRVEVQVTGNKQQ
ncbi:MAG TPA: OmpA family protein [Burkholderiales bacterium]|nr:OmpA family protein [Burkholderiales bacterium]